MSNSDSPDTNPDPDDEWPADRPIRNPAELLLAFHADTFEDVFGALEADLDTDLLGREVSEVEVVLSSKTLPFPFTRDLLFELAEAEDMYAEAPYRAEALLQKIEDVEGLVCWLDLDEYWSNAPDAGWIPSYEWNKPAPEEWTVTEYIRERLDFGADLILTLTDGVGRPVDPTITLGVLRELTEDENWVPHYSDRMRVPEVARVHETDLLDPAVGAIEGESGEDAAGPENDEP